jgi:hypothetical protein
MKAEGMSSKEIVEKMEKELSRATVYAILREAREASEKSDSETEVATADAVQDVETEAENLGQAPEPQETPDVEVEPVSPEPEPGLIPPVPKHRGQGRPPLAKSGETKRATTVAVLPSVYEATRKICYVQRRTISEVINGFLENFVAENLKDLKKF